MYETIPIPRLSAHPYVLLCTYHVRWTSAVFVSKVENIVKVTTICLKLSPRNDKEAETQPNRTLARGSDKKWTVLREDGQVDSMNPWEAALIVEIQTAILRWSSQGDAR